MNAGIEALLARLGAKREEMLERAGQCQTATELVVWAERFNVKLTQEEAGSCCSLHTVLRMSFLTASLAG
jgi:hypothetical protein